MAQSCPGSPCAGLSFPPGVRVGELVMGFGEGEVITGADFTWDTCGVAVFCGGELSGAPTEISQRCPGFPCSGFKPAPDLPAVEGMGMICGVVLFFGKRVAVVVAIADAAVELSESKVSAMVKGVTALELLAGASVLSYAGVSLFPHEAIKRKVIREAIVI